MVASLSKQPRTAILNPGFLVTDIDKGFLFRSRFRIAFFRAPRIQFIATPKHYTSRAPGAEPFCANARSAVAPANGQYLVNFPKPPRRTSAARIAFRFP